MRNVLTLTLLAAIVLLAACGTPTASTEPTEPAATAPAAPTEASQPTTAPEPESKEITLAGSTSVQPLAEEFANAYMAMYPDVMITVQGGGSSVGVKSAGEGTVDIGNASRNVKDEEFTEYPDLVVHTIARDGIAIVVHPDVSVDGLTKDQVKGIYEGSITMWDEVGGPSVPIIVVGREEGSGTRGAFGELVMDDDEFAMVETAILQPSNGAVVTTVSTTPDSIGFISFGYIDESTKPLAMDGVEATVANVLSGDYAVVRPLNMLTNGEPSGVVEDFLDFVFSDEGQAIVIDEGYISVTSEPEEPEESEAMSGEITLAGSTSVQPVAENLANAFMAMHTEVMITVQGGGSSVGVKSAGEGTVDIGNASREIKSTELDEYPDLVIHTIARDGIAIVVHPDVPVDGLTKDQVKGIYEGSITMWSEVGGSNTPIIVVGREEGSGTRGAFGELVMGDDEFAMVETAILQPSNGAVVTTVSTTPDSIGFISFGYIDESTKPLAMDGVEPTVANASSGDYAVVRPLNMLTKGQPTGVVKAFLDFVFSDEGQAIVVDEGYLSVE